MKKKSAPNSNSVQETIQEKFKRIEADLQEEHDKKFPPMPLSIEDIEYELFFDSLKKEKALSKQDLNVVDDKAAGANINQLSKQVDDLHRLSFLETKYLSDKERIDKMKSQILLQRNKRMK